MPEETQSETTPVAVDTSNYRKHTSTNPVQRWLIDRFHRRLLRQLARLQPASFLDAGCGEGFVARLILDRFPGMDLAGCDLNPAAVKVAAATCPEGAFLTASLLQLPFPDGAFEFAGCFEVLEHLPDPAAALAELSRVARRGVIVSVPEEPFFSLANVARGKNVTVRPRGSDPDHRQFWTRPAFAELVRQQLTITSIGGSFPWTICVATK